jgi:hypothetical protein
MLATGDLRRERGGKSERLKTLKDGSVGAGTKKWLRGPFAVRAVFDGG